MDGDRMGEAAREMTDAEVFGGGEKEMTDEEVFGKPAPQLETPSIADEVTGGVPRAFLDRVAQGQEFAKTIGATEGRGVIDKLFGLTGERYQLWPEKMLRSGFTLAHDVATGELPTQVVDPVSGEITLNPEMIQRSMDMASFQLGQTHISPTVPRGAPAPLVDTGAGQFVRPAVGDDGALTGHNVGGLPTEADFSKAAKVLVPETPEHVIASAMVVNGKVFTGPNHIVTMDAAKAAGLDVANAKLQDGFVTSTGRFVDRQEALKLATKSDQIHPDSGGADITAGLDSDDLKPIPGNDWSGRFAEKNLRRMWQEDGVHPAEAVHDAANDAFLKHEITMPREEVRVSSVDAPKEETDFVFGRDARVSVPADSAGYRPGIIAQGFDAASAQKKAWRTESPIRTADDLFAKASENQESLATVGDQIAADLGITFRNPGIKGRARTLEKIEGGKSPAAINDVVRGGFVVDDPAQADAVVSRLAQHFQVADEGWEENFVGYVDRKIIVRFPNGQGGEIQLWHPDLLAAKKSEGHKLYKESRSLPEGSPRKAELDAKQRELYSAASATLPPEWKALIGKGGSEGNLASQASLDRTTPSMPISDELPRRQEPSEKTQASPGTQTQGSPSMMPNLRDSEAIKGTSEANVSGTEAEGKPGSVGAAATPAELISPQVQPPRPAGSLMASVKQAGETLLDIGRDAQMLVAPMARGTRDSMAMVKDFANSLRRNRWDWARIDKDIADRFTPEQRARMWTAADEESVSLQLGEPAHMREHQGLATLEPAERAAVADLQARAQNAWVRARDAGMVEGDGLPAYTPRMVINTASASSKDTVLPLNGIGSNLKTRTGNLLKRKYLEAQETEAAAKAKYGDEAMLARDIRVLPLATSHLEDAIAGRTLINQIKAYGEGSGTETVVEGGIPSDAVAKYFTLDHPAFKTWRPRFKEGEVVKDAQGEIVFEQVPIYVHSDFEGPLRAVLQHKSGPLYQGLMALKGKTMSLIMNSPMIHNAVEWGRALPAMPGKVATFKVYFEGNRAKNNVPLMQEAIDNGLVPIGHRFFNQDITSIMEAPDLTPGRSWTAKILATAPGLFDEAAGTAVKRAVDKAGDFWHNTLLWDRVADLQMGLYKNFLDDAVAKGIDRTTASRMAAHWANRYAGSLPKEAMSDGATKVANMLMFSRSFTMGNLGVLKDMFTGLPKDVLAQIERDGGFAPGAIDGAESSGAAAVSYAKSMARRKAMAVIAMDMGLFYVGNSILQNALNVMFNDSSLDKELHGYAGRMINKLQEIKEHPLQLAQPLRLLEDVSATSENEPGRQDRLRVGYAKDGTAIYARNPAGKIGEEFLGYMTGPLDMMRKKLGTIARPAWQIMSNDAGFGRKVYDPNADTPGKYLLNLGRIAAHLAGSQLPTGQLGAFHDLVTGEGDAKVNSAQAFGPFIGVTFSKGAPGGPAVGEMYAARTQHDFAVQNALPDIRRQIQRGDLDGAMDRMTQLGIPAGLQRFYVRTTLNPSTRLSSKAVRDFYLYATPEQRSRFERAQGAPAAP